MRKQNRFRALRNLTAAAAALLLVWYLKGCPLPTAEMELHRSERQHLLRESRVVWEYRGTMSRDRDMMVGVGEGHVTTWLDRGGCWFRERRGDGPTVVLLPQGTRYSPDSNGKANSYTDPAFVAVDVPARTQSARLTVALDYAEELEPYVIEGEKDGSVWFFQLMRRHHATDEYSSDEEWSLNHKEEDALFSLKLAGQTWSLPYSYTAEFFDRDGNLIETVSRQQ